MATKYVYSFSEGKGEGNGKMKADLGGKGGDELRLGQHALFDQHPTEGPPDSLLLLVGGLELGRADQPALEQDVAQLLHTSSFRGQGVTAVHRANRRKSEACTPVPSAVWPG